jgi:hypothetical protein
LIARVTRYPKDLLYDDKFLKIYLSPLHNRADVEEVLLTDDGGSRR